MKSPSHETTLNTSFLQAMSNTTNKSQALSVPAPPTTPESRAAELKRLIEILEFTIALMDDSIFDFDPNEPSESHTTTAQ
jgi:hypothetical protein